MRDKLICGCGRGHACKADGICKFCRESLVSRAVAKSVNVRHRGDGMSLDQFNVATGKIKRESVYI